MERKAPLLSYPPLLYCRGGLALIPTIQRIGEGKTSVITHPVFYKNLNTGCLPFWNLSDMPISIKEHFYTARRVALDTRIKSNIRWRSQGRCNLKHQSKPIFGQFLAQIDPLDCILGSRSLGVAIQGHLEFWNQGNFSGSVMKPKTRRQPLLRSHAGLSSDQYFDHALCSSRGLGERPTLKLNQTSRLGKRGGCKPELIPRPSSTVEERYTGL